MTHDGNPAIRNVKLEINNKMKTKNLLLTLAVASLMPLASSLSKDVALADCPAAVQEVIRSNSRSGKIDDVKMITVDGRSMYVAEVDLPGDRDLKLHISGAGALLKVREDIPQSEAPAAVLEAAKKLVPEGGKIDDIDKETAGGKVTYEVEIDRPKTADLKVVFNADGSIVSQREERSK